MAKKKKKLIGRPPKVGPKFDIKVMVPMDASRRQQYQNAADASGMSLAAWIRFACDKLATKQV